MVTKKMTEEEMATAIIELTRTDLDGFMQMTAAVLGAIRGNEDDDFLNAHRVGSDPLRLETSHWRIAPAKDNSKKDAAKDTVAKLLKSAE